MSVKVLTAGRMREVDRVSIEDLGIPGMVLMENAGRSVVEVLERRFAPLSSQRITVLCGRGNNGGDGLVVGRHLRMRGHSPRIVLLADPGTLQGDAKANYEILAGSGVTPAVARNSDEWAKLRPELFGATLLVDAILGTGLKGPVEGFLAEVIRDINMSFAEIPVVAVDIPSGLASDAGGDSGKLAGESLRARVTVTFTAPKWSQVLAPGSERVGELIVAPIGTPSAVYENDPEIFLNLLGPEDLAPFVRDRDADSHKGDYGHVLVVGGSRGKSGAAALSAMGALGSGAGLVTAATAASILPLVAGASPVIMTEPLAETDSGTISLRAFDSSRFTAIAAGKSVLALGPGISTNPETVEFVRRVVKEFPHLPTVIDADGLNAFAGATDLLQGAGRKLILTPHPGEMARLTGLPTEQVQSGRVEIAREFARKHQVFLVLKGYRTLIAEPGGQVYVNPVGNPGMATAGTGDVLTGMIAGLLAQHPEVPVETVVSAAVYWHGAAGDQAAARRGQLSMTALDLLHHLPRALPGAGQGDGPGQCQCGCGCRCCS